MTVATGKKGIKRLKRLALWLLSFGFAFYVAWGRQAEILAFPQPDHVLWPNDPDIWVRLTQVRQWLQPGGFFDHLIRNTNAPFGGVSTHWTRPLDILLVVFTAATPQAFPMDTRLLIAAAYLPPCLGLCALFFMSRAAFRLFENTHVLGCLVILFFFSATAFSYFAPGDSDHHGLLCMLWTAVICFAVFPPALWARVLLGISLGLMLWVSPEALLLIAAVYGVLGIYAIMHPEEMPPLAVAALAAAVTVNLALFVEVPPDRIFNQITYDTLSVAHVAVLYLAAAGATLLALLFNRSHMPVPARFLCSGLTGMLALLVQYVLFPKFFYGPLVDADSFIFTDYLPHVPEAQPLFRSMMAGAFFIVQPVLAAITLVALLRGRIRAGRRRVLAVLGVFLAVAFGMAFIQMRFIYYLQPVAMIILAAAIPPCAVGARGPFLKWMRRAARGIRPYVFASAVACLCIIAAETRMARSFTPAERRVKDCYVQMRYILQTHQLERLTGSEPLILFGPEKVAGDVLFFTPFRVTTILFHREGPQMREWQRLVEAETAQVARELLSRRHVDALFVCAEDAPEKSWLHRLGVSGHPSWLVPVPGLRFMKDIDAHPVLFRLEESKLPRPPDR